LLRLVLTEGFIVKLVSAIMILELCVGVKEGNYEALTTTTSTTRKEMLEVWACVDPKSA